MKSFDEMAADFVAEQAAAVLPYVLTDLERQCIGMGYIRGVSVGIQSCTDALTPIVKEEKGL